MIGLRRYPSSHSDLIPNRVERRHEQWGRRSVLFVRADDSRHLKSALTSQADAIVLDLETVPTHELERVRAATCDVLKNVDFRGKEKIVRIHGVSGDKWYDDIIAVMPGRPDTILPPWAQNATEMLILDAVLAQLEPKQNLKPGHTLLMPLIEVVPGLLNVVEIAQSTPRMTALMFGSGDYAMDMDHPFPDQEEVNIQYARQRVVEAARLVGIDAIDTPWFGWEPMAHRNLEAFRICAERARSLGFDGKSAHTPGQVDVCNSVYSPTPKQVSDAKQFIEMQEAHYAGDFGERNEYYLTTWTLPAEGVIIRSRRGPKKA
jgi:citrate lyase subunit beta/citryl-CoA lyase